MKGHKAVSCLVSPSPSPSSRVKTETDDEEQDSESSGPSYLSPPPSPPPPSTSQPSTSGASSSSAAPVFLHRTYTPAIMSEASFEIPETGYFHRVNPNYREYSTPRKPRPIPVTRSMTPTDIVGSDGQPASVRSSSPASTDSTVLLSERGTTRPGDVLGGLGSLFNLKKSSSAEIAGNATSLQKRYPYWNNGTAVIDGTWEADKGVSSKARTAAANFVASSGDFFIRLWRSLWGFAPHFFATLVASLLANYICRTYL
ncbi:hypothetical protein CVT26_009540 [Gymnopilus dilepis]|uniref:Uncharacterized protein n=1 Tax=Gymnopilus dilepis TaxID=231916 RepID=A0A409VKH7_9AGAR|nr:hypothetical protein CVT26_009540 [Gymnopilus dilepis]